MKSNLRDAVRRVLFLYTGANQLIDLLVCRFALRKPKERFYVPFVLPEEAISEFTIRRQSQAIAVRTEWLGNRIDETDSTDLILK
jgi:hypothetical protein